MTDLAARRRLWWLLVPIGALIIAVQIGDALTTTLAEEHPLLLAPGPGR